jgi:hypothetical protein
VRSLGLSDRTHDGVGQLGVGVGLATHMGASPSSLAGHVCMIASVRVDEQVSGIHAGRVIAVMACEQVSRDRAVCRDPPKSVGGAVAFTPSQPAIALPVAGSGPQPAGIGAARFVGVVVQPLRKRPVMPRVISARRFSSHDRALQRPIVVRPGTALLARFQAAFFSKSIGDAP